MQHLSSGMLIIITSDEPWSNVWHTQLHYANQLSRYFHVIYMDPPQPWKIKNLFGIKAEKKTINSRLLVIPYHNLLPTILGSVAKRINDVYNEARIIKYSGKKSGRPAKKLIWHFDPFRAYYFFRKDKKIIHVYHVVDPFQNHDLDSKLARLAKLVVVTSPKYFQHYKELNSNSILIKQGVDIQLYNKDQKVSSQFAKDYKNCIVLLGTLSNQIDFKILHEILNQSTVKIIIIGPDLITDNNIRSAFSSLCTHARCEWMGAMSPEEYIPYLKLASVGLIVYNNESSAPNNLRSPLKVISYLAAGIPVITNIDSEIPELMNKGIYFAAEHDKFLNLVQKAIRRELEYDAAEVEKYLESIDYNKLLETIFSKMGMILPARIEN
jgi:glycosyltransferase involved in cell wall biosynthesis